MNAELKGYLAAAALAALAVVGLHQALSADLGQRNYEALTEMVYSRAGEAFARNDALPGGRTEQALVPGTVVRGDTWLGYGPGPDEAARAGRELHAPVSLADPAVRKRGAELYGIYCVACHDAGGGGRGKAVLRGMLPPPSLTAAHAMSLEEGTLFHILTFGQGNMASYAAQLTPEERWEVVSHVLELQGRGE